jgi:AmiR/NasT family two-component response regulator
MTPRIPNFRGQRALILHRQDRTRDAITEQLERLGLEVSARWPAEAVATANLDVVFFDADNGFDGLFGWTPGQAEVPLIAVLGSETPGRLEWTLTQAPSAYLMKPIGSTGIFTALTIGFHVFGLTRAERAARAKLEERLRSRDLVMAAAALVASRGIDAPTAIRLLRQESMTRRTSLEAVAELVLSGKWLPIPNASRSAGHGAKRAKTA